MAQIISGSIDVSKIDKARIQTHDKNGTPFKNGAKYYNVDIIINDEFDQYGNCCQIVEKQTKEERDAKAKKKFIGNGKRIWMSAGTESETKKETKKPTQGDGLNF